MSPERRLVFRFSSIPWVKRLAIAQELELIADEDRRLSSVELARRVLGRARDLDQLGALWDAVSRELPREEIENPFQERES